jgi:hypothetical protein
MLEGSRLPHSLEYEPRFGAEPENNWTSGRHGSGTLTADQVDGSVKKWLRGMRRNVDPNGWPVRTSRHPL